MTLDNAVRIPNSEVIHVSGQNYLQVTLSDTDGQAIPLHLLRDRLVQYFAMRPYGSLQVVIYAKDERGDYREVTLADLTS